MRKFHLALAATGLAALALGLVPVDPHQPRRRAGVAARRLSLRGSPETADEMRSRHGTSICRSRSPHP